MPLSDSPRLSSPRLALAFAPRAWLSLGAFQRAASALRSPPFPLSRRLSGGPALHLSPGTLLARLSLPSPSALVPDADPPRLVNRHVRPLLQALRKLGLLASYPGRDWVAVAHRPLAWIGFAHHAASGACAVEFCLPYEEPFTLPPALEASPARAEPPWRGQSPATLRQLSATPPSPPQLLQTIAEVYQKSYRDLLVEERDPAFFLEEILDERPPWRAQREEVIGFVGASGPPSPGLGGDFFASEDLMAAINQGLSALPTGATREQLQAVLEAAVSETGGVLEGVRSATSLLDALEEAFAA